MTGCKPLQRLKCVLVPVCVITACACAAEVYSSNIVGYQKVNLNEGLNLVGSQFVNVGDEAALDINKVLTSDDLPGLDENFGFQSMIQVWTGSGYTNYGWLDADDGDSAGMPDWNSTWLLEDLSDVAVADVNAGEGFWIQTSAPATATFSGQVLTADTTEITVESGLNLICNPYPQSISIQKVQSTDLLGLDENFGFQSIMQVWTGSGYTNYGWLDADDGDSAGMSDWNSTWLLEDLSDVANVEIGAGEGFWIQTSAPATITFTK